MLRFNCGFHYRIFFQPKSGQLLFAVFSFLLICPEISISIESADHSSNKIDLGIQQYRNHQYKESITTLQSAISDAPDNTKIPYYIGLNHLQLKQFDRALSSFEQFQALKPASPSTDTILGHLSLIRKEQARAAAIHLVANETISFDDPTSNKFILLHAFSNTGSPDYDFFAGGLKALIHHDLDLAASFSVIDPLRVQALYDALELNNIDLADHEISLMTGRLLHASYIVSGNYQVQNDRINSVSTLMESRVGNPVVGKIITSSDLNQFFQLEKMIVFSILEGLGIEREMIPEDRRNRIEQFQTTSLDAFAAYSRGVTASDKHNYGEAGKQFRLATSIDSDFMLARQALAQLPVKLLTMEELAMEMENAIIGNLQSPLTNDSLKPALQHGSSEKERKYEEPTTNTSP